MTLAAPETAVEPLVSPGLRLDAFRGHGLVAAACVQTRKLRPSGIPSVLGLGFFLVGYRIFVRLQSETGRSYRGLQILGSETDRWPMVIGGRIFTHYGYRKVAAAVNHLGDTLGVSTPSGFALEVSDDSPELPETSIFSSWQEARRFAGPMPFTFAPERGKRVVLIEGVRDQWHQKPMRVVRASVPFLDQRIDPTPTPAAAFFVENVDYRWKRGRRERVRSP